MYIVVRDCRTVIRYNSNNRAAARQPCQRFCRCGATAPASITSRSGAARGLVGRPRGAACVTRDGLQVLQGGLLDVLMNHLTSDSHDNGLFVIIWELIPIFRDKQETRESPLIEFMLGISVFDFLSMITGLPQR